MNARVAITICILFSLGSVVHGEEVIRLYPGPAPGTEEWTHEEKQYFSPLFRTEVVTNVSQPTLTAYLPDSAKANGTAVIIAPGGAFHALSINSEGVDVAKWLNKRGVAGFVLRYRLFPTGEDGVRELIAKAADPEKVEQDMESVAPFAGADGLAAVRYVREHAEDFGIAKDRIGFMGFSAGGAVTAFVTFNYDAESRPDFVALIYAGLGKFQDVVVPEDAPPMFVAAATDDQLGLAKDSASVYGKWLAAGKSAEVHIYSRGGHAFGIRKQNLPVDTWIERFGEWLAVQGLLKAGSREEM